MPRRNRNAHKGMSTVEREKLEVQRRHSDFRDLKRELDSAWNFAECSKCELGLECNVHAT